MDSFSVDSVVIGAGVVGLAVARALAISGHEVVILEQADAIGTGVSSRNSEVIHAGIYYPTGSKKAEFCVRGNQHLYEYCAAHHIPFKKIGKLIVATNEDQIGTLGKIYNQAQANGVTDLKEVTTQQLQKLEPQISGTAALLSPSTGIIDSHALMVTLLGQAENAGAILSLNSEVQAVDCTDNGFVIDVGGLDTFRLKCKNIVNAAGLGAVGIAKTISALTQHHIPEAFLAKGTYFGYSGRIPFTRLIYPVPEPGALGVHATFDLQGGMRFGPDIEWVEDENYRPDEDRSEHFYARIRQYWPSLPDGSLYADYCGIRPKIHGPNTPLPDFNISSPQNHGISGLVNMFGIESPGLTSVLPMAEYVSQQLS